MAVKTPYGVGGGSCPHPHSWVARVSGGKVWYPCTGDGVSSGAETAVPVVAGAAMRQGSVGTGNRASFEHSRLPVFAKRSYDLQGALGAETGARRRVEGR